MSMTSRHLRPEASLRYTLPHTKNGRICSQSPSAAVFREPLERTAHARKAQEMVNLSRNTPGSTQMNEVNYKTKNYEKQNSTYINRRNRHFRSQRLRARLPLQQWVYRP
jgi:hypothetical protein